jgi:hypothetical protein
VDAASAGASVACPKCGQTILVPQLEQPGQEPPPVEPPSRAKGWRLAVVLVVFALLSLVFGVLLGQKHRNARPAAGTASTTEGPISPPATPKNPPSGLVLYFNFDSKPVAGMVPDLSGHGNNGQATNVQWIADGHRGGAVVLSPLDSHIRVPNNDSLNPEQFTVSAWIKTSRADRYWRRIFDKGLFHNQFDLTIAGDWEKWNPPTKFRGFIEFETLKSKETTSRHSLADGQWHQIVATYDGQDKQLFVDGQSQGTTHYPNVSLGNNLDLVIGGFADPDPDNDDPDASFDGSLDDVMMFNRALSPDDVAALYNSQKTASDAGNENQPAAQPVALSTTNAGNGTVTVDFDTTTNTGSPYVFGGTGYPKQAEQDDIYPKLLAAGITSIRGDYSLEKIIPLCASVDDYNNNVNNIQDPTNWDFDHLYWIDAAKTHGLRTMLQIDYCPPWLSCNGKKSGVPSDWSVWEDIVRKVYTRYRSKTDWIELWNEPDWGTLDIKGSPYANREDAVVDLWYHTENAIRSVNPNAITGGLTLSWNNVDTMQSIVSKAIAKYGTDWANSNLNFISWHEYSGSPGATDPGAMRGILAGWGLNPDKPIFITEWNHLHWDPKEDGPQAVEEVGFVGRALARFIESGVAANYFSLYPYNGPQSNPLESFYSVNPDGRTGKLSLRSWPFRVLSNDLGLGKGYYAVKQISNQQVIGACAAVNSKGQKVVFIANYYDHPNTATVTLEGLSGNAARIVEYWAASPDSDACVTNAIAVDKGTGVYSLSMKPQTCVGLIVKDNG